MSLDDLFVVRSQVKADAEVLTPKSNNKLSKKTSSSVKRLLGKEYTLPNTTKYDTGAAGQLLESEMGVKTNSYNSSDLRDADLKFHGGSSTLLTLFHKAPYPKPIRANKKLGVLRVAGATEQMWEKFGYEAKDGHRRLYTTIKGDFVNNLGLSLIVDSDAIRITHNENILDCWWKLDSVIESFGHKLRCIVKVDGTRNGKTVTMDKATSYSGLKTTIIPDLIKNGIIVLDFDVGVQKSGSQEGKLKDRGVKFRIDTRNMMRLYAEEHEIC